MAEPKNESAGTAEGCDCTELCSMGPTCPGGMLAGLPGSGCPRSTEKDYPADGTVVRLKRGMPGTYEGQTAIVHHRHPTSGHSNLGGEHPLVWLECDVIWSHGTAEGFWAARAEYVVPPVHACPPEGSGVTPCCGKTLFELPRTDRMTIDEEVTCRG